MVLRLAKSRPDKKQTMMTMMWMMVMVMVLFRGMGISSP
jgi:hypothetical protein